MIKILHLREFLHQIQINLSDKEKLSLVMCSKVIYFNKNVLKFNNIYPLNLTHELFPSIIKFHIRTIEDIQLADNIIPQTIIYRKNLLIMKSLDKKFFFDMNELPVILYIIRLAVKYNQIELLEIIREVLLFVIIVRIII